MIRRYSGVLNRFYVQENKPVYYGFGHDSILLAAMLTISFTLVHVIAWFTLRILKQDNRPLAKLVEGPYLQNNALLIALLLEGWLVGYCTVSWVIWFQFERGERLTPDDYMPVIAMDGAGNNNSGGMIKTTSGSDLILGETIVQLPDGDFVLGAANASLVNNEK